MHQNADGRDKPGHHEQIRWFPQTTR